MKYLYTSSVSTRKFTDSMKEVLESHFNKLDKYLSDSEPVKVTLDKEGNLFILKCQAVGQNNKRVRSHLRGEDYYQLVSDSADVIKKQLKKKREKSYWKERITREEFGSSEFEDTGIIKRVKHFILNPMAPEEAIDEMNILGHDFFSFRDVDNKEKISIVYRRFDGTFGLIELN